MSFFWYFKCRKIFIFDRVIALQSIDEYPFLSHLVLIVWQIQSPCIRSHACVKFRQVLTCGFRVMSQLVFWKSVVSLYQLRECSLFMWRGGAGFTGVLFSGRFKGGYTFFKVSLGGYTLFTLNFGHGAIKNHGVKAPPPQSVGSLERVNV